MKPSKHPLTLIFATLATLLAPQISTGEDRAPHVESICAKEPSRIAVNVSMLRDEIETWSPKAKRDFNRLEEKLNKAVTEDSEPAYLLLLNPKAPPTGKTDILVVYESSPGNGTDAADMTGFTQSTTLLANYPDLEEEFWQRYLGKSLPVNTLDDAVLIDHEQVNLLVRLALVNGKSFSRSQDVHALRSFYEKILREPSWRWFFGAPDPQRMILVTGLGSEQNEPSRVYSIVSHNDDYTTYFRLYNGQRPFLDKSLQLIRKQYLPLYFEIVFHPAQAFPEAATDLDPISVWDNLELAFISDSEGSTRFYPEMDAVQFDKGPRLEQPLHMRIAVRVPCQLLTGGPVLLETRMRKGNLQFFDRSEGTLKRSMTSYLSVTENLESNDLHPPKVSFHLMKDLDESPEGYVHDGLWNHRLHLGTLTFPHAIKKIVASHQRLTDHAEPDLLDDLFRNPTECLQKTESSVARQIFGLRHGTRLQFARELESANRRMESLWHSVTLAHSVSTDGLEILVLRGRDTLARRIFGKDRALQRANYVRTYLEEMIKHSGLEDFIDVKEGVLDEGSASPTTVEVRLVPKQKS